MKESEFFFKESVKELLDSNFEFEKFIQMDYEKQRDLLIGFINKLIEKRNDKEEILIANKQMLENVSKEQLASAVEVVIYDLYKKLK